MDKQTGFLLSYLKYGDNDAVLHSFTKENGYQSYFLKGIYTAKNKKKVYLQPCNELDLISKSSAQNSGLVQCLRIEPVNLIEAGDIKLSAVLFFISDFLNQVLRNEEQNDEIYNLVKDLIRQVSNCNFSAHITFAILLLKAFGLSPLVSNNVFLDPSDGIFRETQADKQFSEDISGLWKQILSKDDAFSLRIPVDLRTQLLNSIMHYYLLHFSGFKLPESLEIIRQFWQ